VQSLYFFLFYFNVIFRNRLRMYPAFVNCTTIDWFTEWPKDALLEVAEKYLEEVTFEGEADAIAEVAYLVKLF